MKHGNSKQINEALAFLKAGELVALPTETVYGLGADAKNPAALSKIFLAKERPFTHPLIVHLAGPAQLSQWASVLPQAVKPLAEAFWPGPLTLILKKQPWVSDLLTGGQDSIGLRIPAHPMAQALLQAFGSGIAAPSANRFTHLSPTTAQAVREELGAKVACILDGGPCEVGLESTILDLSRDRPIILRPGMISASEIETVLQKPLSLSKEQAPHVPGSGPLHYAPETQVHLVSSTGPSSFLSSLRPHDLPLVILTQKKPAFEREGIQWIVMAEQPQRYAQDLYQTLRALDKQGFKKIVVETPPHDPGWEAIHDRLRKAAGRRI